MGLSTLDLVAGIAWDPTIRGLLTVVVGVVVLMGSVYLLLATNAGNRMGFLLSAAGFFGWMVLMGIIWWMYGIGMVGESPSWEVIEVNTGNLAAAELDEAQEVDVAALPPADELNALELDEFRETASEIEPQLDGWRLLPLSDTQVGEAQATVDEFFQEGNYEGIDGPSDYISLYAFDTGGKDRLGPDPNRWDRIVNKVEQLIQITHPTHYAILQVQPIIDVAPEPGQAPPSPTPDPDEPVISVVMVRDLGDLRFPPAMITLSSLLIFGLLCWMLHQRDQLVEEHLVAAES